MSLSKIRSVLYKAAKLLGDVSAVRRGRILQRVQRRAAGKITGRLFARWFR